MGGAQPFVLPSVHVHRPRINRDEQELGRLCDFLWIQQGKIEMQSAKRWRSSFALVITTLFCVGLQTSPVSASIWNNIAGGSWANAANWDSLPNGVDAIADFSTLDITADATVTLDSATTFTVGSLLFGDTTPTNNWIVNAGTPAGTITLAVTSGSPTINVLNQTATINATLAGTQGFTKTGNGTLALTSVLPAGFGAIIDNAGVLTLSGANNYTAGTTLASGATLNFNNISAIGTGPLLINGGTLNNSTGAAITNSKNWSGLFVSVRGWRLRRRSKPFAASSAGPLSPRPGGSPIASSAPVRRRYTAPDAVL
jgi:autotransporter-associated beta strand protein